MEVVSNTSPLIFLTKVPGLQPLLERQFSQIWVPRAGVVEAVEAALASAKEGVRASGRQVEALLAKPRFTVVPDPLPLENLPARLGSGEKAALALALAKGVNTVLIDERPATNVARQLGLRPLPVSALPLIGLRRGWLEPEAARVLLEELVANQYRLSARDWLRLLAAVEGR